jgi:hypothetical protein
MSDALPAITIWQPWGSLILLGAKPYEFRGWAPPRSMRNHRIAIHAGARPVRLSEVRALCLSLTSNSVQRASLRAEIALPYLERLRLNPTLAPRGVVLCTATLGECVRADRLREFASAVNDSDRDEHFNFAWPLTDIRALHPPVAARGAQGFWSFRP